MIIFFLHINQNGYNQFYPFLFNRPLHSYLTFMFDQDSSSINCTQQNHLYYTINIIDKKKTNSSDLHTVSFL